MQPDKSYVGVAWYSTGFTLPASMSKRNLLLLLERPHWETTVWVDGVKLGMQNSLSTPHRYVFGNLKAGEHVLTIRVDNRVKDIDVGENAHSISDHTQTNWNGIAGDIIIYSKPTVFVRKTKVYPDTDKKEVKVVIDVDNTSTRPQESTFSFNARSRFTPAMHKVPELSVKKTLAPGVNSMEVIYPMGESYYTWDEFEPYLYELKVRLATVHGIDSCTTNFGMRKHGRRGTQFTINDRAIDRWWMIFR